MSRLRLGTEVSSIASRTAKSIDPPPGKKRKRRERVYGIIVRSVADKIWEVLWSRGEVEECFSSTLKFEGEATEETLDVVRNRNTSR